MNKYLIKYLMERSEMITTQGTESSILQKTGDFDEEEMLSAIKRGEKGRNSNNSGRNTIIYASVRGEKDSSPQFGAPQEHLGFPIKWSF